jgi:hypothetical protein
LRWTDGDVSFFRHVRKRTHQLSRFDSPVIRNLLWPHELVINYI